MIENLNFVRCAAIAVLCCALVTLLGPAALAQTDEIQVYTGEINAPGQYSLTLHNNYIAIGRKQPDFPGGVTPNGALNGVPESAYGVTDWFEIGAYAPFLYTLTNRGQFELDGAKLRFLFVAPHAKERTFVYGVNFEFSYNARHCAPQYGNIEVRPILGLHLGNWDLIINPIVDIPFETNTKLDFAPAARVAYNLSDNWAVALEHYADYGTVPNFQSGNQQAQTGFAVVDYASGQYDVEFGIGHGFTAAADALVLKLIVSRSF